MPLRNPVTYFSLNTPILCTSYPSLLKYSIIISASLLLQPFGAIFFFKIVSIEVSMGDKIARLVTDFTARFGDKVNMYDGVTQAEVGNWLGKTIGVGEGWLLYFVEQETGYREDKAGLIDPKIAEGVTINALREGLLYMYLTQYAKRQGFIILDMETTSNYMMGSLRHYPAPCIMGNSFDPNNPISRRNIRQPFNLPVKAN